MEELFERFGFLIILFIFWLFNWLGKKLPKPQEQPMPLPRPLPKAKVPKPPFIPKVKPKQLTVEELPAEREIKEEKEMPAPSVLLKSFSREKLREGIILSIILGQPKSLQLLRRGGGIGIHAGLKNP